jgi:general secretion pathway protein A
MPVRAPFESRLDPGLFFASESHSEALARLEYLVREGGTQLGLLTGEVGCGKSLTRAVFAARSAPSRLVAQITSSHYPFGDLLRDVLMQFGGTDPGAGAPEMDVMARVQRLVAGRAAPAVILLDEAQELDRGGLVGVRALVNLADGRLPLTVVLVGQPELRQRVLGLPQLDQRAGLRFHLCPLGATEVGPYLEFRLRAGGDSDGKTFADGAVAAVAAASHGVPREINRIARLALALAGARGSAHVEEKDVEAVVADLEKQRGAAVA